MHVTGVLLNKGLHGSHVNDLELFKGRVSERPGVLLT